MTELTKDEKLKLLAEWKECHDTLDEQFNQIGKCFDTATGPLFDAAWLVFTAYTKTTAVLVGDKAEWLDWYWHENDMGKRKRKAGYNDDVRPIETLDDLLWVIEGLNSEHLTRISQRTRLLNTHSRRLQFQS